MTAEPEAAQRFPFSDFCKQIEQDIPIWEAKIYRDKPALARGEAAITEFRNWAQQSYAAGPR